MTVLLLAFGAVLTALAGIAGIVAAIAATTARASAATVDPGAVWGSLAAGVGAAFVIGVVGVVLSVAAWIRRRSTWWIAVIAFVLATVAVVLAAVFFAHGVDAGSALHRTIVPGAVGGA